MARNANIEPTRTGKPSLAKRGVAAIVVAVAAIIIFHFVVHIVLWLVTVVVVIAAVAGLIWAANALL